MFFDFTTVADRFAAPALVGLCALILFSRMGMQSAWHVALCLVPLAVAAVEIAVATGYFNVFSDIEKPSEFSASPLVNFYGNVRYFLMVNPVANAAFTLAREALGLAPIIYLALAGRAPLPAGRER